MTASSSLPLMVALGDSEEHKTAMTYASSEAVREGRDLVLVHVVHPVAFYGGLGSESILLPLEVVEAAGKALTDRAASMARDLTKGKVAVRTETRLGDTVQMLVTMAEDADRVILQHRQMSALHRVFTGSVSAGVAGRCSVPVVSVPENWKFKRSPAGPRVTVALAGHRDDERLLEAAFADVASRAGTLTILHAWYLPSVYDDAIVDRTAVDKWSQAARDDIEIQLTDLRHDYPGVEPRIRIKHMRPADALVEASRHSDLLIVGRSRSTHHIPHLGSLTRAVIRESVCPVEVVPLHDHAKFEQQL